MKTHNIHELTTVITPDDAAELLGNNPSNRRISKAHVTEYQKEMMSGAWAKNGQTILIAKDGRLLDGQHRLTACVAAQQPIEAVVITGLDLGTMATIDTGKSRTVPDILAIFGYKNSTRLAALGRIMLPWVDGNRSVVAYNKSSIEKQPLLRYIEQSPELANYVSGTLTPIDGIPEAAHRFFTLVLERIDPVDAAEFLRILRGGTVDEPDGHPVVAYRRYIANAVRDSGESNRGKAIAGGMKAWNAWRDGYPIKTMRIATGETIQDPH